MKNNTASFLFLILFLNFSTILFVVSYKKFKTFDNKKNINFKHILIWSLPNYHSYFHNEYNHNFVKAKCRFKNCLLIHDMNYFQNMKDFDAIIFFGPNLWNSKYIYEANKNRISQQTYIFATQESSHNYPICYKEVDGFFNLTWTYKLNSNLVSPYFVVKDKNGKLIGPTEDMNWIKTEDMKETPKHIKKKLKRKHKKVAWLVSDCIVKSNRSGYAAELAKIESNNIDVFGTCGRPHRQCGITKQLMADCWDIVEDNYYFYLSFENSFSADYVTEKVLNAIKHYTVPIVYGTANYTRFMPDGMYLNAKKLSPKDLSEKINHILFEEEEYLSYFKWHNHYSFHDPDEFPESNKWCELCLMLNSEDFMSEKYAYEDFRGWWNEPGTCG